MKFSTDLDMKGHNLVTIVDDLLRDEGFRAKAYRDHLGFLTIGIGMMIDPDHPGATGIPRTAAKLWLLEIITERKKSLNKIIPWWAGLSDARQRALLNMAYQLGVNGLLKFKKALAAMEAGDFETAAVEVLDSEYAKQTPARAQRIAKLIRIG